MTSTHFVLVKVEDNLQEIYKEKPKSKSIKIIKDESNSVDAKLKNKKNKENSEMWKASINYNTLEEEGCSSNKIKFWSQKNSPLR